MDELVGEAVERSRQLYDLGETTIFAASCDPRFHYMLYVPQAVDEAGPVELVVAVHGTGRTSAFEFRQAFIDFAEFHRCAVFCPIFPANVMGDGRRSGYKYMIENELRYDRLLLAMIAEASAKYGRDWSRFALFGYSGGGHFAHRFAILQPEHLWAVSIGAPGSVTLLDETRDWWVGVRDLESKFGSKLNLAALKDLPVQMVVGALDLETWEITHKPGSLYYMDGANDAGETRVDRLTALAQSFRSAGISVSLDVVQGVSHDRLSVLPAVKSFLSKTLTEYRSERDGTG